MQNSGAILPAETYKKIEHEEIAIFERIEISRDADNADNADQKVKWFLKVHKTYKLLWEAYFKVFIFPSFYSRSNFTNFPIFTPLKMKI